MCLTHPVIALWRACAGDNDLHSLAFSPRLKGQYDIAIKNHPLGFLMNGAVGLLAQG